MDNHETAGVGHNVPPPPAPLSPEQIREWLAIDLSSLVARAAELTKALKEAIDAAPVIETEGQLSAMADNMRMAAAWKRTAEERRKDAKAPFLDGGREIDAWFREVGTAMSGPLAECQKAMDAYQTKVAAEKRRAAEAAAAKAREEADRKAAEAAAAAFADGDDSEDDAEVVMEKVEAAQRAAGRAERAEGKATGSVASHVRSHTDLGTVATGREVVEFDVTEPGLVAREFLVVDPALIRAWLREQMATPEAKAAMRRRIDEGRQPLRGVKVRIEIKGLVR